MPELFHTAFASAALLPEVRRDGWPTQSVYPLRQHSVQLQHIRHDVETDLVGAGSASALEGVLHVHDYAIRTDHVHRPAICADRKARAQKDAAE